MRRTARQPGLSAAILAAVMLGAFVLLFAPPVNADTPVTLYRSFAGNLNFVGTEATLRTQNNNGDACAVTNSISATLSGIPTDATIEAAYLYWAGSSSPDEYLFGFIYLGPAVPPDYTVTFQGQTLTAPPSARYRVMRTGNFGLQSNFFSGVADVTSIVEADRNGSYTLSGLTADTRDYPHCNEQTVLAGWSLLVIYSDSAEDFRVVNIYQGFQPFQDGALPLQVTNFRVPGSPNGKFGHITWEGDNSLNGAGEKLQFDGNSLTDSTNPAGEQFNSKSSIRTPDDTESWGVDFDQYDISQLLTAGQTSATSTYSSGQDLVLLSAEVLSITNTPVSDLSVTVSHTGTPSPPGPIEYQVAVQNDGPLDEPGPVTITATLPAGISYVSWSGAGWSCSASGSTVTCTAAGPESVGATLPSLTINGYIAPNARSPADLAVTVSGTNFDNDSSNDEDIDRATWANPPPLTGPSAFNITEPGTDSRNGPIYTKIAGESPNTTYTLDLWALNGGGPRNNPKARVELYLLNATDNSGTESPPASGCRNTWPQLAYLGTFNFNKSNPLTVTLPGYADALHEARIKIVEKKGKKGKTGDIACSSDAFAVRPAYFVVTATDSNRTTAGTSRVLDAITASGTPFHNAGQPFMLVAEPRNAQDIKAANYMVATPKATAVTSVLGATLGALSTGGWTTVNDNAVAGAATYSEAGALSVEITDPNFAAVDRLDTPACQRTIGLKCGNPGTPSYWRPGTKTGRFVPDHFAVTRNAPKFAAGCAKGDFTYAGDAFGFTVAPTVTVSAQNAAKELTKNYTASLFRLTNASLSGRSYTDTAAPADAALNAAGLPATTSDPTIADNGDGTATLTFSAGAGLVYAHGAPVGPFTSRIDLSINVQDRDSVTVATIDGASAANPVTFNDIAFDADNEIRYGRMFVGSAVGSELLGLPVSLLAQYYKDANDGFVANAADTCTSGATVTLDNFQPYPSATFASGDTAATLVQPSVNGVFDLSLSAPGAGHQGTVDVTAHAPSWLQFDWDGDGDYGDDPKARAAFGLYKGNPHRVYQTEIVGP